MPTLPCKCLRSGGERKKNNIKSRITPDHNSLGEGGKQAHSLAVYKIYVSSSNTLYLSIYGILLLSYFFLIYHIQFYIYLYPSFTLNLDIYPIP